MANIEFEMSQLHNTKPFYKNWKFYVLGLVSLFVIIPVLLVAIATNSIIVSNGGIDSPNDSTPWWGSVTGLFRLNSDAVEAYVDPNPLPEYEEDRFDVLIMGMRGEAGDIEDGKWLTDTMLIVSVDNTTGEVAMTSLPRDIYLDMFVPEFETTYHLKGKINEVYIRGLAYNAGIKLSKQVVSKITGIYIDKAIVFDFVAFQEIVDTLDGVDIYLNTPFVEPEQWGFPFELPEGENHLTGEEALYYVRSRFYSSDFDRARRQQQVIQAIKTKALSLGFLANPVKVTSLLGDLKGNVRTDFQLWEINDALSLANSLGEGSVNHTVLTTENVLYETTLDGIGYVLLPASDSFDSTRLLMKNQL